jgi:catechol 2,3-dioxygenase-like lactoylglutathione lyase family enzyme
MKILVSLAVAFVGIAQAQLPPPNTAGVTMGHVHLNVSNVEAQRKFWVDLFGATSLKREGLQGVKVPGMLILFTPKNPTAPSEGAVIDHFGFKVRNTEEFLKNCRDAGFVTRPAFRGVEGFPNAYIDGPDGVKVEIQEDSARTGPPEPNHVHYLVKDVAGLRDWYVKTFGAVARKRGTLDTADISSMNLTFQAIRDDTPRPATKRRALDHVGFEVTNLEAFCKKLEADGVHFDVSYRKIAALGIAVAFLTDPMGGYIELTEGLDSF